MSAAGDALAAAAAALEAADALETAAREHLGAVRGTVLEAGARTAVRDAAAARDLEGRRYRAALEAWRIARAA